MWTEGSTRFNDNFSVEVIEVNSRETKAAGTFRILAMSRIESGRFASRNAIAKHAAATLRDLWPHRKLEAAFACVKRVIARGDRPVALNDTARDLIKSANAY